MDWSRPLLLRFIVLILAAGLSSAVEAKSSLNLFVAASLADVAADIGKSYRDETGISIRVVPAATSTLARQIAAGAPADVFLSADREWVDWLVSRNIGNAEQMRIFAGNALVIVAPNANGPAPGDAAPFDPADRSRIALADPDHVPAGRYARQVLEADGRWAAIAARIVPAANVRDALRYVETGQTGFGIVYATDVRAGTVRIVAQLPDPDPPIRYVALPLDDRRETKGFVAFLSDGRADAVLCRHGFRLPEGRAC